MNMRSWHELSNENTKLRDDKSSLMLAIDTALDCLKQGDVEEARKVLERAKSRIAMEKQS